MGSGGGEPVRERYPTSSEKSGSGGSLLERSKNCLGLHLWPGRNYSSPLKHKPQHNGPTFPLGTSIEWGAEASEAGEGRDKVV